MHWEEEGDTEWDEMMRDNGRREETKGDNTMYGRPLLIHHRETLGIGLWLSIVSNESIINDC